MKKLTFLFILLFTGISLVAQNNRPVPFNGLVSNLNGQALAKVRVTRESTGETMRTDKKGKFGFNDVAPDETLIFYTPDKQKYAIPVEGKKSMKVIVLPSGIDASEDQELLDIGYGYIKRRDKTQASSGISGEELRRSGHSNLMQALQGRVPGLSIQSTNMGQEAEVNIRGKRSIMGSNTPLFVLDGVIVESISHISIYDVEYVEVLKEASIYGSRGANGAILIKTKR